MSARTTPPPLPSEVLARTIRLGSIDGRLVLWLSGCFALLSAASHDVVPALAGCVAAGAGAIEVHGAALLRQGEARGLDGMIRAQLLLLATILIYSAIQLTHFDPRLITDHMTPELQQKMDETGLTQEQFIAVMRVLYQILYVTVGFAGLLYQGGMARYYARRRAVIEQALLENHPA